MLPLTLLLFAISALTPIHVETPADMMALNAAYDHTHPAPTQFQLVNTDWDNYNLPENWEKALAVPVGDPEEYAQATEPSSNTYRGMGNGGSDVSQWAPLVAGQFPPEAQADALCVIKSESGGNPNAKNPNSNARGLFQVMTSVWADSFGFTYEDFYVPELNTYAAARIWESSGWSPWSPRTRRNCGL